MSAPDESETWVSIDRFFHPTDAHIAAGRLRAEGVPVHLLDIHHASTNWLIAPALGGIRLQVPCRLVPVAREILAAEPPSVSAGSESCPRCGSRDTSFATNAWKLSLLAVHLLSIPLPWRRNRRCCNACGDVWSEAE